MRRTKVIRVTVEEVLESGHKICVERAVQVIPSDSTEANEARVLRCHREADAEAARQRREHGH